MKVATALRQASKASPEVAAQAVQEAMDKAGLDVAGAVLLFLTSSFAREPEAAILAAARAANSMQVSGCTALGVFTEQDWVLDAPAAAVMVFDGDSGPVPAAEGDDAWRLTLAAPSAVDTAWLNDPARRFGGVSGDATGRGPYRVWSGSRLAADGRVELAFSGSRLRADASRGIRTLSTPVVARLNGQDIDSVGGLPPLLHLARHLPADFDDNDVLPLHRLMAGIAWGDPDTALAEGRYHLLPLLGIDLDTRRVSLAGEFEGEAALFWALRDPAAAERDMATMLDRLAGPAPAFGLCFPCIGRGPGFYDGQDRDTAQIMQRYPGMPLLGFYGNGEIVHSGGRNQLLQYSTVLALGEHVPAHA